MGIKSTLQNLLSYLVLVLKKWYLILILSFDLFAIIIQYIYPSLKIPSYLYGLIAIIGLFIAGFNVYSENLKIQSSKIAEYEKTLLETGINREIEPPSPNIILSFLEGSEFSYKLDRIIEEPNRFEYLSLPIFKLRLNFQFVNIGNVDLKIIGINTDMHTSPKCFAFSLLSNARVKFLLDDENEMAFPYLLRTNDSQNFHIESEIEFGPTRSDLIYAADLRKEIIEKEYSRTVEVTVKSIIPESSELSDFSIPFQFSVKPLYELLFQHWSKTGRLDLLEIARIKQD